MTPAVLAAQKAGLAISLHEYDHDPASDSYGEEAAEKLGVDVGAIFKTLVVQTGSKKLVVAVIPVRHSLNLKRVASAAGEKKAEMADKTLVQRTTGYVLGGVSPLGQRKALTTVIDSLAKEQAKIYVSGGRRGLDIAISPADLAAATRASFADLIRT
ncbi:MAG: Cys-tRNA(Pro) deacylase [Acidiferrobacterales bacterium]|nr:Cys-tRNA(Pro) deacylase [Acidiferrobacterales bacterium]